MTPISIHGEDTGPPVQKRKPRRAIAMTTGDNNRLNSTRAFAATATRHPPRREGAVIALRPYQEAASAAISCKSMHAGRRTP